MDLFEYKFVRLPRQRRKGKELTTDGTAFAPPLQREINLIAAAGWQFVGREEMAVERRRWIILRGTAKEDFLVFRRAIRSEPASVPLLTAHAADRTDAPKIKPRRVERNFFPDRLRPVTTGRKRGRPTQLA